MAILKNRFFLMGVATVLLIGVVLLVGQLLAWSWTVRLLGVILVLFLLVIALAVSFARAARGADAIEQSIKMQAQQQARTARPDRQRDVEDLQRQLERAILMLKQSRLGQGRRGRAALYALPWYLFIGPPGAGKTTAIANSGLNFPIGTDRVRGVGGTRNCDWFFSDRAILLDTAGRYVTEPEDEAEWQAFLETLKKHRPDRPVNGVIVGIALPELSEATLEEVEWHADMIRSRIEELIRLLGLRFPIYLTFTKCDLLQGFVEFFGELSRSEREQVWGCTLTPEQREGDAAAVFEDEFDQLYEALLNRRIVRLSHTMKREERQKVYAFPLQFSSLKEKLSVFIHRLFQPNPYQETPVFRGFYFTSGTQEGVPIDRVIQAVAAQFDLPPMREERGEPELEVKSYFIRELFTDVIIPDQHLARRTSGATRHGRFLQARAAVAGIAILALFVFGASQALVRSQTNLNRTREAAAQAALVRWNDPSRSSSALADLSRLREQIDRLESPSALTLGLQRGGTVLPAARGLYLRQSQEFVRTYPLRAIAASLDRAGMASVDSGATQRTYDDLKAYLLLTQEVERLRSGEAAEEFRAFLARHLAETGFGALQSADPAATGRNVQDRIAAMTDTYVAALAGGSLRAIPADGARIASARRRMDQPLNLAGLYAQLRTRGIDRLSTISLDDLDMPPRYRGIFDARVEIDRLYTKEGWEDFAQDEISRLSQDPTREDWVLGRSASAVPDEFQDTERVAARLRDLYFAEYATAWEALLRNTRIRQGRTPADAAEILRTLGNTDSPILYLLAFVAAQTQFEGEGLLAETTGEAGERIGSARSGPTHPVDRRFSWLHRLNPGQAVSGGAEAAPELNQALEAFKKLADEFEALGSDEDALAFAATTLQENGGALETEWRAIQRTVRSFNDRAAARSLFEVPVLAAWGSALAAGQRALSAQWQEQVFQPYQRTLAGRFPFARAEDEASVLDVDAFFNPQTGTLATFVAENLRPFLSPDMRQAAAWNGQAMPLGSVLQALGHAQRIQDGLFSQGGVMRVNFELRPDLPERTDGAPPVAQVYLDLHGQRDTYNMGVTSWRGFEWPAGSPNAALSITTQLGQLPMLSFSGDWAMFRLLQAANIRPKTASLFEVRWSIEQAGQYTITALYEMKTQRAGTPLENPLAFFQFSPPPAIR